MIQYDRRYNASYDYARLLAVIGIIWFHAQAPGGRIGYSGLAVFVMLLVIMALPQIIALRVQPHRAPPVLRYAATRGRRLLVPWLIASVFYGGLKLIEVSRGAPLAGEFTLSMWLTGPALHLWFLPFAFAICILLWPLGRALGQTAPHHATPLALACVAIALAALSQAQTPTTLIPLAQWTYALPAVVFGAALSLTGLRASRMLGLTLLFACCALAADWTVGLTEITLAALILALCAALPLRATALSSLAGRSALALYLIHPAVMAVTLRAGLATESSTALALTVIGLSCGIVALWETIAMQRLPTSPLTS